jgi:murein DD-endopeptidase MepM/ murein hydrolase activator NlpD
MDNPTLVPTLSILKSIQKSLTKIETLVKSNASIQKKQTEQQRKQRIFQTRQTQEKQSETPKLVNPLKYLQGALPKTGFLDAIRNFILYTFMGFAFTKLVKFLPKILSTLKFIDPFIKFTDNFVGSVFKNFVNAIDLGYEQYDKVRALAKQVGGEKFEKQFDELSSTLNKFLNTAIIVGFAIAGSGAIGGGGKKLPTRIAPKPGVGPKGANQTRLSQYFSQTRAQESITKKYGFDAARLYQDKINRGSTPTQALNAVKQRFSPRDIPTGGLGGKGRTQGAIRSRGLGKVQQRASLKLFGKAGSKILGKVPIIGPIADFLISTLIFKERPDRAAAGAVGGAVGAALGSFPALIPFGGPIWGGILGDIVGRSLFDTVTSMQGQGEKIQKKAAGGPVTRGGKPVGRTIKRTVSVKPRSLKRPRQQLPQPGQNIGGIKQIKKIFSSPKKPGRKNPLRALKGISEIMNKNRDPLFGGIMIATSNLPLGQKPDPMLGQEIKNNFAALIDNAIAAQSTKEVNQIQRSVVAAAKGGVVPVSRTLKSGPSIGEQLGAAISNSFQNALNSRTNQIFQSLRREMGLKGDEQTTSGGAPYGNVPEAEISENQRQAADDLIKYFTKIYGRNAAIGIVANLLRESGLRTYAPEGGFNGMAQWDDNRWSKLVAWANAKGKDPMTRSTQAEYIVIELNESGTGNRIKNSKTPEDAASLFYNEFERAAYSKPIKGNAYNPDNPHERKNRSFIISLTGGGAAGPAVQVTGGIKPSQIPQTSAQGMRRHPITGELKEHKGIDLDNGDGSPISSAQDAQVVWAGDKGDGYGNTVVLRYSNGAETRFAHLKSTNVRKGTSIKAGQMIGRQGNTGLSTASHLHFEYYPRGGAMTYRGYGDAASVKDSYFRYGGNVTPITSRPTPARQQPAPSNTNQPIKNYGVVFKNGKFYKLGPFGLDKEEEVTDRNKTHLRLIPTFGLGRGKEGQIKQAANGIYYKFTNGKWISIHAGGNASIQNNIPSSSVAKAEFTPLPIQNQNYNALAKYDPTSDGTSSTKTNIVMIRQIEQVG